MSRAGHEARVRSVAGALLALSMAAAATPAEVVAETSTERRLRLLEQQVREAQGEIERLRGELAEQKAAAGRKEPAAPPETARTAASAEDWLRKVTLFGDVRVRHEGFYHQPHAEPPGADPTLLPPISTTTTARNRERLRARIGVKLTYSDELSATVRAATGDPNNPVSTNETLTGTFSRKHVNLDWAFITFSPGRSFGLRPGVASITAGKFPNPIFRADELVFDDDLAPEGVSETVSLLAAPVGALDQVKIHGLQWTFNEVASAQDGWMFGGQIDPQWHVGGVAFEAGIGQYWWLNADQVAQALNTNTSLINSNLLDTATTTANGKTTTSITGYQSGFDQTNLTLAATVPNVLPARPLRAFVDYVYNWEARTDDANGWLVGLRLGQAKTRGDWAVTGFYEHLGQEAAISAFTYDDFGRGGTNAEGGVVALDYQLLDPLTVSARGIFTNAVIRPRGVTNPTQSRIQLDALVKF
jgi:putative porin